MAETSLVSLLRPALLKAAEDSLGVGRDRFVLATTGLVSEALAAGVAGGAVKLALTFFQLAIGDSGADRIADSVKKLTRQHLVAGISELQRVLRLTPQNPDEEKYRSRLAMLAREKLALARAVEDEEQMAGIDLLMGMAAALVTGGEEDAVLSFHQFVFAADVDAKSLEFRAEIYDADSLGLTRQSQKAAALGIDLLKRSRLERRAQEEAVTAARFRASASEIRAMIAVVVSLSAYLMSRRSGTTPQGA